MIDEDDIYPIISITNESLSSSFRLRMFMHIDQTSILHASYLTTSITSSLAH